MKLDDLDILDRPYFDDYPEFEPFGSPRELLALGIFGGQYFDGHPFLVPDTWDIRRGNYFGKAAGKSKQWWLDRGLIVPPDELGWFQWYMNFYAGRRHKVDQWQIRRWSSFNARHGAALMKQGQGIMSKSRGRRQALLQWACNPVPDMMS